MAVYFIADTHFGHESVAKWRYDNGDIESCDIDFHDNFIYENIISISNKRSILYVLGDFCIRNSKLHLVEGIVKRFHKVYLIMGNHDVERSYSPTIEDYIGLGVNVRGFVKYKEFWLSHPPIHQSQLRGKFNIHGHTHNKNVVDSNGYFNVSCESIDYKPIELSVIRNILVEDKNDY